MTANSVACHHSAEIMNNKANSASTNLGGIEFGASSQCGVWEFVAERCESCID